jgi:hypothetical protein
MGLAAILLLGMAACGSSHDSTSIESKAAIAAAKCHTPVQRRFGVHGTTIDFQSVTVKDLGNGRLQVTGIVPARPDVTDGGSFTCVVVPDATDELRGLRIEQLAVQPPT